MHFPHHYHYFWPLFVFTTLVVLMVSLWNSERTPGALRQCDFEKDCGHKRFYLYDNSWLCCEDAGGWAAAHVIHPLALTLLIGWPEFVLLFVFYYEALEADATTLFKTFVFVPSDPITQETLPGSIIADAQIQGVLGILLGISLMALFNWHGFLFPHWNELRWGVVGKYLIVIALYSAAYPLIDISDSNGTTWGLALLMVYHAIYVLFVIPLFIRETDLASYNLVESYARVKWFWAISFLAIALMNIVPRFLPNYYYQIWIAAYTLILIYQLMINVRHYSYKPGRRAAMGSAIQINN